MPLRIYSKRLQNLVMKITFMHHPHAILICSAPLMQHISVSFSSDARLVCGKCYYGRRMVCQRTLKWMEVNESGLFARNIMRFGSAVAANNFSELACVLIMSLQLVLEFKFTHFSLRVSFDSRATQFRHSAVIVCMLAIHSVHSVRSARAHYCIISQII